MELVYYLLIANAGVIATVLIGVSLSEPHTSELKGGFSYTYLQNVLHCGASLSKHWYEGEKSKKLVSYRFCTYVTGVGGACVRACITHL